MELKDNDLLDSTLKELKHNIQSEEGECTLKESVFVNYYLDMFRDLARNPKNPEILMSKAYRSWLDNTNGGLNSVNIVDDNDIDKLLFVVPKITMESNIDYTWYSKSNIDFTSLPTEITNRNNYIPGLGDKLLTDIVGKFAMTFKNTNDDEIKDQWLRIFQRYSTNSTNETEDNTEVDRDEIVAKETEDLW